MLHHLGQLIVELASRATAAAMLKCHDPNTGDLTNLKGFKVVNLKVNASPSQSFDIFAVNESKIGESIPYIEINISVNN